MRWTRPWQRGRLYAVTKTRKFTANTRQDQVHTYLYVPQGQSLYFAKSLFFIYIQLSLLKNRAHDDRDTIEEQDSFNQRWNVNYTARYAISIMILQFDRVCTQGRQDVNKLAHWHINYAGCISIPRHRRVNFKPNSRSEHCCICTSNSFISLSFYYYKCTTMVIKTMTTTIMISNANKRRRSSSRADYVNIFKTLRRVVRIAAPRMS